jgi:hypothetical protein
MHYGDHIKLLATDGEETRRFKLNRSAAASSNGYRLYGYNPDENALNLLEDFSIDDRPPRSAVVQEAKNRIQFYVGDGWTIETA